MTEREAFIVQLSNQPLTPGDVIVLLQGDGYNHAALAAQLYVDGFAPTIALVGGDTRREYGSYPGSELRALLIEQSVPATAILFEETAVHTRAEAVRIIELAEERGWKNLIIVTSPHHMYRAYLTFLAAMREHGLDLILQSAPVRDLSWYTPEPWGRRADLLALEFKRIEEYGKLGHVASFASGVQYLEWKESQARP